MTDPSAAMTATITDQATPTAGGAPEGGRERNAGLWADAGRQLIRSPMFLVPLAYLLLVGSMAAFPRLWTSQDPRACDVARSRIAPSWYHPFGFNNLGCDYYSHAVYGARPSLVIAIVATAGIVVIGGGAGLLAGFFSGWTDTIISRIVDIFFSLPFLLGAIVFLTVVGSRNIWTIARIMRGSVLSSKNLDYVAAAKALGSSNSRLMMKHILPNAVAPVLVYSTIAVGVLIAAEATLTYLGVGLQRPAISWGLQISTGQSLLRTAPHLVLFPSIILSLTVMAFIMMGDALRDALDPRQRS